MSMHVTPGPISGGHTYIVERASFSPDGEHFVAGDLHGGLIVRTRDGRIAAKLRVPPAGASSRSQVCAVAWSPDSQHIAVDEYGGIRLRRSDLAEVAMLHRVRSPMAFGDGGRLLATLSSSFVSVVGVPALENLGHYVLVRGSFDSFSATTLAADARGSFIAAGDDGGSSETAMGMKTAQGDPQVTLIRAGERAAFGAIERGNYAFGLEFDPWRGRLLTIRGSDIGAWSRTGEEVGRFAPYGVPARALAVSARWIATAPDVAVRPRIDFFDPDTYEELATVESGVRLPPAWIAASPDGSTLVTPELPVNRDYAVRIWSVEV